MFMVSRLPEAQVFFMVYAASDRLWWFPRSSGLNYDFSRLCPACFLLSAEDEWRAEASKISNLNIPTNNLIKHNGDLNFLSQDGVVVNLVFKHATRSSPPRRRNTFFVFSIFASHGDGCWGTVFDFVYK